MSANKKRHRLPKEDLAATVADIINSPITRSNLSFLRPLPTLGPEETVSKPDSAEPTLAATPFKPRPMGLASSARYYEDPEIIPPGFDPIPMGVGSEPRESKGFTQEYSSSSLGEQIPEPMGFVNAKVPSWSAINRSRPLWQAEGVGTVFEQPRVRRIQQAQDALSLIEEKVYDLLWGPKNQKKDDFRLVHYSLQRIATEARVNIKTVRELIPRLIDKGFIAIEHEADVRRNIPTLYRVSSYTTALNDQKRRNRAYVTKTGKGVFYVHPISASFTATEPLGLGLSPVGVTPMVLEQKPMGDALRPEGLQPRGAVGLGGSKPMGASGPLSIDILLDNTVRQTTSTTYANLRESIKEGLGVEPDEALLIGMLTACHKNALDTTSEVATEEELIYFTASKVRTLARASNIRNHLAVLKKAVPECFVGETFRAYRAASAARKKNAVEYDRVHEEYSAFELERIEQETQDTLWAAVSERHRGERGYDMRAIAEDEELDERGKQQARGILERLGRFTRSGL